MRHRLKVLVTTTVVAGLILTSSTASFATIPASAGSDAHGATLTSRQETPRFDGRELFAGLLLGQGPVAEQFPQLVAGEISTVDPAARAETTSRITDAVNDIDPTFFARFSRAVTSGDRVQVDQALRSAADMLLTALTDNLGGAISKEDNQIGSALYVAVFVVAVAHVTVAAEVNVAVAANVAWAVNVAWVETKEPAPEPPGPTSMSRIDHERWVDRVAEALAR